MSNSKRNETATPMLYNNRFIIKMCKCIGLNEKNICKFVKFVCFVLLLLLGVLIATYIFRSSLRWKANSYQTSNVNNIDDKVVFRSFV